MTAQPHPLQTREQPRSPHSPRSPTQPARPHAPPKDRACRPKPLAHARPEQPRAHNALPPSPSECACTLAMIAACTAAERRFSRRARIACSAHAKITSTRPQRAALRALLRSPHVRWPAQHRQSPFSSSVTREERKGLYFLHRLIWREDHDARPCEEARYQLLAQRPFLVEALAVVTREDRRKIISTESEYSSSNRRDRSSNQRTPGRASAPNRTRAARRPIRSGARRAEVLADETAASALTRRGRRHLPSHVKAGAARLIPAHRAASAHTAASRVVRTSAGDRRTIAMLILRPQAKL